LIIAAEFPRGPGAPATEPAPELGAGLIGAPELIVDRVDKYGAAGVELPTLNFHPMMYGLRASSTESN
jgi:hypothetical protein